MAASALATPLMKASEPMKPMRGLALRLRDQMLGAAEADLEAHFAGIAKQRAQVGGCRLA